MSAHALPPSFDWLHSAMRQGTLRNATGSDAFDGVCPEMVAEPVETQELAEVLARATSCGVQVAPRGGGSKMGWGGPPSPLGLMVSTAGFNRVLECADQDLTVTVESGITIAKLQKVLAERGQCLALDPLWPERATVGGVVAANDTGTLRLRFGGVRDLIIGATIVLPDGTVASSGGKVVKNVAGYDLPKLMVGAFGTLGIITRAVFRVHPLPEESQTLTAVFPDATSANRFLLAVADSTLVPTGLQLRASTERPAEVDVRFEGIRRSVDAQRDEFGKMLHPMSSAGSSGNVWRAREELCCTGVVCKVSMLPSQLASTLEFVRSHVQRAAWDAVIQSTGLGFLRVNTGDFDIAREVIAALRSHLKPKGGALVVLGCPPGWKREIGVWEVPGGTQPLMERIKAAFDPKGILNRGRFVGGL